MSKSQNLSLILQQGISDFLFRPQVFSIIRKKKSPRMHVFTTFIQTKRHMWANKLLMSFICYILNFLR